MCLDQDGQDEGSCTHLTSGIKTNHENSHLLLAEHAFEDTRKRKSHLDIEQFRDQVCLAPREPERKKMRMGDSTVRVALKLLWASTGVNREIR